MIKKIIGLFCLLIAVILPAIKGSETTEAATTTPKSPLTYLVERCKEARTNIIERNLLAYMGRYDKLTERKGKIDQILNLFSGHLRFVQQPQEGYNIILEDIRANPNVDERVRQLLQIEELIALVNSRTLSPESLTIIKARLDQRKQRDLAVRIGVIMQRIIQSDQAKKMNADLLNQIKTTFDKDLEKLHHYRDEETVSRWVIESPLPAAAAAATPEDEAPLPILADVVRDYIELTQTIKQQEISYLHETLSLLSRNRAELVAVLDDAKTHKETPQRNELIRTLENDITDVDELIHRERSRLTKLES